MSEAVRGTRGRPYRKDELREHIRVWVRTFGSAPSVSSWRACPHVPSYTVYLDRWGSWDRALLAAGIDPDWIAPISPAKLRENGVFDE